MLDACLQRPLEHGHGVDRQLQSLDPPVQVQSWSCKPASYDPMAIYLGARAPQFDACDGCMRAK